ncbi:uncharacterized protein A4U43_C04F8170 [Asparagus officinalis]|uniref:Uncharacterized protein n=1 Tax=Asparagus officinalis TaxID=4686 RepID=A0A5P1F432_ASPOF|nr:uncharacterized protein A4U43_C04F8170 [Asparagus officinalis]
MFNSNSQSQLISTGSSSSNSSTNLLQAAASSSANQITSLTLPNISLKLNRDNYPTWAPFIHHALECFDFEHLVDKDDTEPPKFVAPSSEPSPATKYLVPNPLSIHSGLRGNERTKLSCCGSNHRPIDCESLGHIASSNCCCKDLESYDSSPLSLLQTSSYRLTSRRPINSPSSSPLMSPSQSATHKPSPSSLVLEEQATALESPDHTAAPIAALSQASLTLSTPAC